MTDIDKPEEKKTVEIVAPSPTEIAITELRRDLKTYTTLVERAIESQSDLVSRVSNIEERQKNTSDRVRGVSESDLKQSADIAAVIARVDNLGEAVKESTNAQTAVLVTKLDALSKNPTVKIIVGILGALLAGWAAGKGITIK